METNADQLSELMQRYARGEDSVFEELYRLMAPRLYRFCVRLVTANSEADDLLQETMLRVHRARATYLAGVIPRKPRFSLATWCPVVTLELGTMSERKLVAYILLKEEGLSVKEAAAVLGTSAPVVRQRAHRAYEQLGSALGAAGWKEVDHDGSWDAAPVRA